MKAIVLCYKDADPGPSATEIVLLAEVVFVGADVPGQVQNSMGAAGNGVPIALNLTTLTAVTYSNAVEAALVADAARLGLPTLLNTDVLLPTYTRGT